MVKNFLYTKIKQVYDNKDHLDDDVADCTTDKTVDDLQQDVAIEVASLQVFGKTK